jgi:ElaB/YqjD/DUF883 family membrane-anchored ribosome-binding protein
MIKNIAETQAGVDTLIDRARDAFVGVTDHAEHGAESAAENITQGAQAAGDYLRHGAKKATRQAHRRVHRAARAVDRGYAQARSDLDRAAEASSDFVAENPGRSLLIAASAGFLLGLLVRLRRTGE